MPDERWGSRVVAVVAPRAGAAPTYDEIAEHCRTLLAGYKVPRAVVLAEEIGRTNVGKADYAWASRCGGPSLLTRASLTRHQHPAKRSAERTTACRHRQAAPSNSRTSGRWARSSAASSRS
ncbi:AMP-binding enzyme [Yinghuangia aomiensis]